jgi:hypothetical protein
MFMAKELIRRHRQIKDELIFLLSDNGLVSSFNLSDRDAMTDFSYIMSNIVASKIVSIEFPDNSNLPGNYVMFRNQIANYIRNQFYDELNSTFKKTKFQSDN